MGVRPGYKHAEVGVIPEEWEVIPLSRTARRISRGASPRPIDSPEWFDARSSVGWVRISDVTRSHRYLEETTQRLSEAGIRNSRYVPSGSLIMSICATVGRPIETRIDACIHDGFVVFDQPTVNQAFLYHVLADLEPTWSRRGQTGSQMNLNTGLINGRMVAIPAASEEQRAIAVALGDVDALLGGLDQLIAKKRDLKQAAMQQLLTGQTRLPGFHGEWEVKRLGEISTVKTGPFGSSLHESDYVRDGTPIITVEHLGEFGVEHLNLPMVSDADHQRLRAYMLNIGDVVFSRVGSVDRNALIRRAEEGWLFSGRLLRVRPDRQKAFAPYLSHHFHGGAFMGSVREVAVGQTMASLNTQILKGIPVTLPPLPEQTAIAGVLTDMDRELAALEQRLVKTRALKQAMMQELLTGRTRLVTQDNYEGKP